MRLRYFAVLLLFIYAVPVSGYTYNMTWSYTNHGTEAYNMTAKDLGVPVFPDTSYQTVVMETSYTNPVLLELEPGFAKMTPVSPVLVPIDGTYVIEATYRIESSPIPAPKIGKPDAEPIDRIPLSLQDYTVSNSLYPANNTEIVELATGLTAGEETVYSKVLRLLDWFEANTSYTVNELPKRPEYMIRDPRGDCDDLSLLFITMCRSQGIPAYLQAGLVLSESMDIDETDWSGHYRYVFDGAGWHAWAMVYIPPWGWLPVDLTVLGGMNPVETITEAYYWRESTIIAWNITSHDYILDDENQREALIASNVVFTQVDELIVEEKEETPYLMYGVAALLAVLLYFFRQRIFPEA